MNNCKICNKEIKDDSQFIDGNWYHNNCIIKLSSKLNEIEKYCEDGKVYVKSAEEMYKSPTNEYASESHLLLNHYMTFDNILHIIKK